MKTVFEAIGEKITRFIEKHHMTQQDFADRIGVSKQVMSKIVKGQKATNIQEIQKIAEVMNISVDELINPEPTAYVIEEPILFMMDKTDNSQVRRHLQFLDFVMDEIIELEELSQKSRRVIYE